MKMNLEPVRGHDPQKITDWLIVLGTMCSTKIDQSGLEVMLPAYVAAAMDDLPPRAFSMTTLRAARRHFTRWPSYAELYQWFEVWLPENPDFRPEYFTPNTAAAVAALPQPLHATKEWFSWMDARGKGLVDDPPGKVKPELR